MTEQVSNTLRQLRTHTLCPAPWATAEPVTHTKDPTIKGTAIYLASNTYTYEDGPCIDNEVLFVISGKRVSMFWASQKSWCSPLWAPWFPSSLITQVWLKWSELEDKSGLPMIAFPLDGSRVPPPLSRVVLIYYMKVWGGHLLRVWFRVASNSPRHKLECIKVLLAAICVKLNGSVQTVLPLADPFPRHIIGANT